MITNPTRRKPSVLRLLPLTNKNGNGDRGIMDALPGLFGAGCCMGLGAARSTAVTERAWLARTISSG
jgi:hypothetical protein